MPAVFSASDRRGRNVTAVRAASGSDNDTDVDVVPRGPRLVGLDKEGAAKVLAALEEANVNVDDAPALRAFVAKSAVVPVAGRMLGAGVNGIGAAWCASSFQGAMETNHLFFAAFVALTGGLFASEALGGALGAVAAAAAAWRIGNDAPTYAEELRALAGLESPTATAEAAAAAVAAARRALDAALTLRENVVSSLADSPSRKDTLSSLSALGVLTSAQAEGGAAFGGADAVRLAEAFARLDLDGNGRIDARELAKFAAGAGMELKQAEAEAAAAILARDGKTMGFADFAEWVEGRCEISCAIA